jgi:hypothetical protein
MAIVRDCAVGRHRYSDDDPEHGRAKCKICGSVQIDLTGPEPVIVRDPTRVFAARRATLFSLRREAAVEEPTPSFGRSRHRKP